MNITEAWDWFMITIIRERLIIGKLKPWHDRHAKTNWMRLLRKIFHPLVLTSSRATLFPAAVICSLSFNCLSWAQAFWLIGWITDALDGPWAVVTGQKTRLGAAIDPVCDRIYSLSAILATVWMTEINNSWQLCLIAIILLDMVLPTFYLIRFTRGCKPALNHEGFGKTKAFGIFVTLPVIWANHVSADWQFLVGALLGITIFCSLVSVEKHLKTNTRKS